MNKKHIYLGVLTALFASMLAGCGGGKATKIADFEGEWKNIDGDHPKLSFDANGTGLLSITFSPSGGGRGGLSMNTVKIQQHDGQFSISASVSGEFGGEQTFHFDLISLNKNTLKLSLVDSADRQEFTLKRK